MLTVGREESFELAASLEVLVKTHAPNAGTPRESARQVLGAQARRRIP
jgi:hypothetical protein